MLVLGPRGARRRCGLRTLVSIRARYQPRPGWGLCVGRGANHSNPADAFASYEQIVRPFIEANQALASSGGSILLPRPQEELDGRNRALAAGEFSADSGEHAAKRRQVNNSLKLPDYDHLLR
jgi:hypothetical protein